VNFLKVKGIYGDGRADMQPNFFPDTKEVLKVAKFSGRLFHPDAVRFEEGRLYVQKTAVQCIALEGFLLGLGKALPYWMLSKPGRSRKKLRTVELR
jgi:hypothetical protein